MAPPESTTFEDWLADGCDVPLIDRDARGCRTFARQLEWERRPAEG